MGIFKKKASKVTTTTAPEETESTGEIKHIEELSKTDNTKFQHPATEVRHIEVPVCLSQAQVNNMIIENNMMLKELMAMANED